MNQILINRINVPTNLSNLKRKVDQLDVDKLLWVPVDLSKLGDAAKNDIVKKDGLKAKINQGKSEIPNITNLDTTATVPSAKINEVKNKVTQLLLPLLLLLLLKINYLMLVIQSKKLTVANISEIENKIYTDHDHDKYITTQEFNIRKFYCKTKTRKFSKQMLCCTFRKIYRFK